MLQGSYGAGAVRLAACVLAGCFGLSGCSGGSSDSGSDGFFQLVEFLEAGQDQVPRNRTLTFRFSAPVGPVQDFPERIKIENVQQGANSNFSRAIGDPDVGQTGQGYLVVGDTVIFVPRLPRVADRSDAGMRAFGNYVVFLKGGGDALQAADGSGLPFQQEFIFNTNDQFEDPIPTQPPRALGIVARNPITGEETDLGRLDPRPNDLATLPNSTLIANDRFIEPGAGGPPNFGTPWHFDLLVSEPLDPNTIKNDNVEFLELFGDATDSGEAADPAVNNPGAQNVPGFGTPAGFRVPFNVTAIQSVHPVNGPTVRIRVTPLTTLVDNTRYRLRFSGDILGIDFSKLLIGDNGLTGDGQTQVAGVLVEPGGLGYATEFIVRNRPPIAAIRTLDFRPLDDGINPETGATTLDETLFNRALYDSPIGPSLAIGRVGAFGGGKLGPLAVTQPTFVLDTGDTLNDSAGIPFAVTDLDPNDEYRNAPQAPVAGPRITDPPKVTEYDYESISVAAGSTLRIIGKNPARLLSSGVVEVIGTIDASGGDGENGDLPPLGNRGGIGQNADAGVGGPGGYDGGFGRAGRRSGTRTSWPANSSFDAWISIAGGRPGAFPNSMYGEGPGRGFAGGEQWLINQQDDAAIGISASGGGGASHGGVGTAGEDKGNVGQAAGTFGRTNRWNIALSGLIGIRGAPGALYGDREAQDLTGGSGGGAGGAMNGWSHTQNDVGSGGGGGGGGGFLEILSAGSIFVTGTIDVTGGDGGNGDYYEYPGFSTWRNATAGGGGGSGGTVSLVAGDGIDLTGGMLDARGGLGGAAAIAVTGNCTTCNKGGDGGKGFIFLMDADGVVSGFDPGLPNFNNPNDYDNYEFGVVSIRGFDPSRFGGSDAVTELFNVLAADPNYLDLAPGDISASVNANQSIRVFASSARSDADEPLNPDLTTEIPRFEVALVSFVNGATNVAITGDMDDMNPANQTPARDSFARIVCTFEYGVAKEAALGPFMNIDGVVLSYQFN